MAAYRSPKPLVGVRVSRGMPILALLFCLNVYAGQPSVVLYNIDKDKYEYTNNVNETRPIASITKIMTAMVSLDYDKDLNKKLLLSKKVVVSYPGKSKIKKNLWKPR